MKPVFEGLNQDIAPHTSTIPLGYVDYVKKPVFEGLNQDIAPHTSTIPLGYVDYVKPVFEDSIRILHHIPQQFHLAM